MDGFEVPLQLIEIIKWIGVAKLAGMNQAQIDVGDLGSIFGLEK